MKYLTVKEVSEKWDITPRRICILCKEGRIDGAIKQGKIWMIPAFAKKPEDGRCHEIGEKKQPIALLLNSTYCEYKNEGQYSKLDWQLCEARRKYLEGELEESKKMLRSFIKNCNEPHYLVVAYDYMKIVAAARGEKDLAINSRLKVISLIKKEIPGYSMEEFLLAKPENPLHKDLNYILNINEADYWECLPILSLMEMKRHLNYILQKGETQDLTFMELVCHELTYKQCPEILTFYHVILSVYYNITGNDSLSHKHLNRALSIALPRKWYMPFVEYRLGVDMDYIKEMDEESYNIIRKMSRETLENYTNSDFLSEVIGGFAEYSNFIIQIGFQIAQGKTNEEISEYLGISRYMLKKHISIMYDLCGVSSRKELGENLKGKFKV